MPLRQLWKMALILLLCYSSIGQVPSASRSSSGSLSDDEQLLRSTEAFLRNRFAWGPDYTVVLGPLQQTTLSNLYRMPIQVTLLGETQSSIFYLSKDGRLLFRGEIFDTSVDLITANRNKLNISGNPEIGPDDARVTLVEFSDLQCPGCRDFRATLKWIQSRYPNDVRVVFKDFPLEKHPWAMSAAVGARCAFIKSPNAFWKIADKIFDSMDSISNENIQQKLIEFASDLNLEPAAFKTCLESSEAKNAVHANLQDGLTLGVQVTPTIFVNGRLVKGDDKIAIEQYVKYELSANSQKK